MKAASVRVAILLFITCLPGCGGNISNEIRVRTFNAYVPATGADATLNFSLSGNSGVAFGQFGNGGRYIATSNQAFGPSASGPGTASPIIFQSAFSLSGNDAAYTLVAAGQTGQAGTLIPQLFIIPNYTPDQLTIPPESAAIRVINLSLVRNPIGLYATTNGTPSGVIGTAVGSVSYGFDAAANAYTAIAARTLTKMALVDTASPTVSLTLSASNNLNSMVLLPGQAYTLYVYGQVDNPAEPLGATWVTDFPAL